MGSSTQDQDQEWLSEDELAPAELKVILLGDSAVGKSKLVERFLLDDYNPRQLSTYALTLFRHEHREPTSGKEYTVDFWDTAGQDQFDSLHPSYYHRANACILGFDVTRKVTYKNLAKWYKELRVYCPDIPVIVVANKIDVDASVTNKKFNFALENELPFYFVSASTGTNVVKVFKEILNLAVKNKEEPPDEVMAEIYALLADDDGRDRHDALPFADSNASTAASTPANTPPPRAVEKSTSRVGPNFIDV
jgi:Rab-like protein 2